MSAQEKSQMQYASFIYTLTKNKQETAANTRRNIDREALECLNDVSSQSELDVNKALEIKPWPCTSVEYDVFLKETLKMNGPEPTLFPMGTRRSMQSILGMENDDYGSHVTSSQETNLYPNFA